MTRSELRCRQCSFLTLRRDSGGGNAGSSPSSHVFTSKKITLLAPEQAGQGLPLDAPFVSARGTRMDRAVELVGLGLSRGYDLIHYREGKPLGRPVG